MPEPLMISAAGHDGRTSLAVTGEVDTLTQAEFELALSRAIDSAREVQLDLSAVTYFGSAGIGALVRAENRARESGVVLTVGPASEAVARVLEVAGLMPPATG